MDKDNARFLLQSFRPDGADATDPDFADALALAAADRELGEWLADERAEDAAMATALSHIEIPADLRDGLLTSLAEGADDALPTFDEDDHLIADALSHIAPPAGLREQILTAMDVESKVVTPPASIWTSRRWKKVASLGSIAAMLVLGLLLAFGGNTRAIASDNNQAVHQSSIKMLSAPLFSLDLRNKDHSAIFSWLEGEDLPTPPRLPEGLKDLPGVGCKKLTVGTETPNGSLICFRKENGTIVHLILMEKRTLPFQIVNPMGEKEICTDCVDTGWAVTEWADENYAYFLLANAAPAELSEVFQ